MIISEEHTRHELGKCLKNVVIKNFLLYINVVFL